ncbi:DUF1465 family protein [Qipengyuania spongiae]|uniref:DUF1465 family protein n=1 Tax=Qipengyuania spongiae TaxID=2909673 RepID=A0ABY5T0L6_9SPHN|nr:DUF1465 family protein [Qipengyuania spongiae]UVI40318.1 DUF1465 family protein [Qipengyuania spongiae]
MPTAEFSRTIIEDLYAEALVLADEAREVFDLRTREPAQSDRDESRIALSIEGLKTTTRIMHVLAWLLNQRAFLSGELSEQQLRNAGPLQADRGSDERQLAQLAPQTRALIRDTERLHARASRLDADRSTLGESAVSRIHGRLAQAFAAG